MSRGVPAGTAVGNLPAAVTSFVGRRRDLGEVRQHLSTARLVTLTGPGGVGKTRMAVEVAAQSRRAFAQGVWLVDLAPVPGGADAVVVQAVATELGVQERSTRPVIDQVIEFLAERQLLIVLDNCEHVLEACASLADQLLSRCAGLRILATSRQRLGINGEHLYPVRTLTVPDVAQRVPVEALGHYEAVALLVDRAAAVRPGFAVTEQNRDAVVRLCAELDGIPLAIELAAARLRTLSVEQVVDRLADRFELLSGGSPAAQPRQRGLRALVDWSYDLCSGGEQRLWARLSVFAGGFDLESAEKVCTDESLPVAEVFELFDGLTARSIIVRVGDGEPPRFRMLETIRQYGRQRLDGSGEQDQFRRRHGELFLSIAQHSADNWCGPGQEESLARLRADHGNLGAALEWFSSDPRGVDPALRLCAALRWHWCVGGFLNDGRRWLDRVLARPADPSPALTQALWTAAWIALLQGDLDVTDRRLQECREIDDQLEAPKLAGHVLTLGGTAAAFRGRALDALVAHRAAAEALTEGADHAVLLLSMFQLAARELASGDNEGATATAVRAIGLSEECGDRWARSCALGVLARCTWLRGETDEAWQLTQDGLTMQRGFRDPFVPQCRSSSWPGSPLRDANSPAPPACSAPPSPSGAASGSVFRRSVRASVTTPSARIRSARA